MTQFIIRALQKFDKLTSAQVKDLLSSMADEIERLEAVLDSMDEGLLVCGTDHNLILANKASERLIPMMLPEGNPRSQVAEQGIWNSIRDDKIASFFEKTLRSGDRVIDREFEAENKGLRRLLSISILPLVKNHRVTGSLIHVNDITEKRGREARMRRMENLASLTTLAAGVAHEIKNPLGSISIHIQLLQKAMKKNEELYYMSHPEDADSDQGPTGYLKLFNRYIGVINEEIERLNHIVVDFLFAVKPMGAELREGNINAFLREVLGFVRFELEEAHVRTVLDLEENLPLADFDERILKQAVLNLIQNAQGAMKGGGTLTIETEKQDAEIFIRIRDTGIGIPEKDLSKIFEPYFTTKENGSGLGLTLVFKIIREHRGEISVQSKEGEGSCFTITLPVSKRERRLLPEMQVNPEANYEV
ncbi:MAG: PAS domain S-box protein [Treponema sp.]|jgi:PAS domain S-box-containing protein|nr:PAS domain S-box protein [Treponema sp.]